MTSENGAESSELERDMYLPSLTDQELEALESLDQSIRIHDDHHLNEDEEDNISQTYSGDFAILPLSFQPFKLAAIPETREYKPEITSLPYGDVDEERNKKINAGYILFDGSEIKYVNKGKNTDSVRTSGSGSGGSDRASSIRSHSSTITQASEIPVNMCMSLDELLGQEYLKSHPRCSITPYRRLPTKAHFSSSEKVYFFLLGLASTVMFNAIFMSVAYFQDILGVKVLSILGCCHYLSALGAMLLVFSCNRHWFPFFPSISVCLVLMTCISAVFPAFAAAGKELHVYAIYGLVCVNGLCTGLAQSVIEKIVILFPGGKSSFLVSWGAGVGCLLPALVQGVLILIKREDYSDTYNTFCMYIVLPSAGFCTLLGLISVAKLRRCGIYGLFADIDCAKFSPKYTTISSSPTLTKKRFRQTFIYMVAVFLVSGVSCYSLSLSPYMHTKTSDHNDSSKAEFWKLYLTTVLLGLYRVGDFIGSTLGTICRRCCVSTTKALRAVGYLLMCLVRLGALPVTVLYIWDPFLLYHNLFLMGFFVVLALTNGFLMFGLWDHCQAVCSVARKDLCPVVSQIMWLCVGFGSVSGVAASFVPLS
ncbi:predicted protein [Nematostella vectensis]|uniref:Uncharacterized protein n=1 Tax=Nematostella vectensis TaxID=45351 RepID=A7SNA2_NEMVE|nr:uncharacterized protein LOC5506190 [Nematostella vectensis]EDO34818.1 predicted protein [Nematostella vectensis]|eukprot:XP_001626918.1 predicted protein [Nematostella vectensis]